MRRRWRAVTPTHTCVSLGETAGKCRHDDSIGYTRYNSNHQRIRSQQSCRSDDRRPYGRFFASSPIRPSPQLWSQGWTKSTVFFKFKNLLNHTDLSAYLYCNYFSSTALYSFWAGAGGIKYSLLHVPITIPLFYCFYIISLIYHILIVCVSSFWNKIKSEIPSTSPWHFSTIELIFISYMKFNISLSRHVELY